MIEDTLARHYQADALPAGHPVREAIDELRRLRADSDELRAVRMALGGDVYWMDPPDGGSVTLAEQVQRANDAGREADALRAERDALTDTLHRHGFQRCDVPACACGQFHHRFGLPERMQEIKDALAAAGHEVCNENGNLPLGALASLVADRDALRADAARYRWLADRMAHVFHPAGSGWTLDEVLVSHDQDLDEVIDALAQEQICAVAKNGQIPGAK